MKVIVKPKRIEVYEAIEVKKPMVLTNMPLLHQEIVLEDGQYILRETNEENNDIYKSVSKMDLYLKEGDMLIKTPDGYMKPQVEFIKVDKKLEKAIELINK